jgi:hypothetical protein
MEHDQSFRHRFNAGRDLRGTRIARQYGAHAGAEQPYRGRGGQVTGQKDHRR